MDLGDLTARIQPMSHKASERTQTARGRLYDVFARYALSPYGSPEGACPHCVSEVERDSFDSVPVAQLSAAQVTSYALAVWPGVSDFKYFLPRVLERWMDLGLEDCEDVERKLPKTGWDVCSPEERRAVADYIVASQHSRTLLRATEELEPARLLLPLAVQSHLASGLPLEECLDQELLQLRSELLSSRLEAWMERKDSTALALLARSVSQLSERPSLSSRKQMKRLTFIPADDLVLTWLLSGQAQQVMESAFEGVPLSAELYQEATEALAVLAQIAPNAQGR